MHMCTCAYTRVHARPPIFRKRVTTLNRGCSYNARLHSIRERMQKDCHTHAGDEIHAYTHVRMHA